MFIAVGVMITSFRHFARPMLGIGAKLVRSLFVKCAFDHVYDLHRHWFVLAHGLHICFTSVPPCVVSHVLLLVGFQSSNLICGCAFSSILWSAPWNLSEASRRLWRFLAAVDLRHRYVHRQEHSNTRIHHWQKVKTG